MSWTRIEVEVEGPDQTSQAATANGRSQWKTPDGLNLILNLILATDLPSAQTLQLQQDCPRPKPEAENRILLCRNYKVNV